MKKHLFPIAGMVMCAALLWRAAIPALRVDHTPMNWVILVTGIAMLAFYFVVFAWWYLFRVLRHHRARETEGDAS
jgi:hypothetical protein